MRQLHFCCRGEWYRVNTLGHITQIRNKTFTENWIFLGVSKHHWRNGIDVYFSPDVDAKELIGGYVWDLDHGTTRTWGGGFGGKLPTVTQAYWGKDSE